MLSDLPPDLVQLGPRFQVDVDGLAADAPRQIPLRPMAPVTGLRESTYRQRRDARADSGGTLG
jgi:hypothetical protein